ncbi:DUF4426 domain-containing protein [Zhongshania sp.]|jgi:hypothetical protein|uniref:DUF4426 domain-containing protein n=1 Tax=Zhongshania sp. TaxID=1971902 RepID=UPI001B709CED|nr:DUF4426 domain-containing protein [Zhongshania sp.]MBQ0797528.1 DUF4426 domain-containing protein [Zhongshania sp.]|tara:strand:+ start:2291 stop:2761 length:471 start_codon:yes stop_codon:yes gene_type:complete
MKRITNYTAIFTLVFSALFSAAASAQEAPPVTATSSSFGKDTVHYSVVNSTFLTPQVAKSYGIIRGDNKFLINVSVRRQLDTTNLAVRAKVEGTSSDLIHRTPLEFREIIEQDAIYYIAEFEISNDERQDFRLSVSVDNRPSYDIQFNKMMYVDDE